MDTLLPAELKDEICKFSYNKTETNVMVKLTCNMFNLILNDNIKNYHLKYFSNNTELVKWYVQNNFEVNKHVLRNATKTIDLKLIKWLIDANIPKSVKLFRYCTRDCNVKNIKWLIKNGFPWDNNSFSYYIINNSKVNIKFLNWMKKNGCPINNLDYNSAAQKGDLKVMKWLKRNGYNPEPYVYLCAAINGSVKNITWIKNNGCCKIKSEPFKEIEFPDIKLKMLKWLKKNGVRPQSHSGKIYFSIDQCKIKKFRWFAGNGCDFSNSTFYNAIKKGKQKNIKWLYESECINVNSILKTFSLEIAIRTNKIKNIKLLLEYGFECDDNTFSCAINTCKWRIMNLLKEYGCNLYMAFHFIYAMNKQNFKAMKWFVNNGYVLEKELFEFSINELKVIKWLKKNGCPIN
jgi:hypothetical protein